MSTIVECGDSGWDASESDSSPDSPYSGSHASLTELKQTYRGSSSVGSVLSYASVDSLRRTHRRSVRPIIPDLSTDDFQYTTVTPVCYRKTNDTDSSRQNPVSHRRSKRSQVFRSSDYGSGGNTGVRNRRSQQTNRLSRGRPGRFALSGEDDASNVSNNDNEWSGRQWSDSDCPRRRCYDAVVMPCCDEPQQNFHFEQNRYPPGCLDIVLNGNDRTCEESDTCSDPWRDEPEDVAVHRFRSSTSGFVTADHRSRSWSSVVSFDRCEELDEMPMPCYDPIDCFEDELMRDGVELVPVSVSLQSLSSSVGVDVRCAEGILCVDTTFSNSIEDDGDDVDDAVVDMTMSPARNRDSCSPTEHDDDNNYEVGLVNNYICCADCGRGRDAEQDEEGHCWFGQSLDTHDVTGRGFNWDCIDEIAGGTAPGGRRMMECGEDDCWNFTEPFDERRTEKRRSKSRSPSSSSTDGQLRRKLTSHEGHKTRRTHRKSNRKSPERTPKKRHRRCGHKKLNNTSSSHLVFKTHGTTSSARRTRTTNAARKESSHSDVTGASGNSSVTGYVDRNDYNRDSDRSSNNMTRFRQISSTSDVGQRKWSQMGVSERSQSPVASTVGRRTGNSDVEFAIDTDYHISEDVTASDSDYYRAPDGRHEDQSSGAETQGIRGQTMTPQSSTRSVAKSTRSNRTDQNASTPPMNDYQRQPASPVTDGNKVPPPRSGITPVSKTLSAPVRLGNNKSSTKRAFRVEKMALKGPESRMTYHESEEAVMRNAQAAPAPVPIANQPIAQAAASYHETDLIVLSIRVPSKPSQYGPLGETYLAGGELFGKPFRYIPVLYPIRAVVSYEDDHGLQRNRTTSTVNKRYNNARTRCHPGFVERVQMIPSVRSSRAADVPPTCEGALAPMNLATIAYLDAVVEQGNELVRLPSPDVQLPCAPVRSQCYVGRVDSATVPRVFSSDRSDVSPMPRKQSVSFADMHPGGFNDIESMYPPFIQDSLCLHPSVVPIPNHPNFSDDVLLNPSQLLAQVAAASDRDLLRPSLLPPRVRSDSIGTSVTQVVSRWRKHYMDNDPCYPEQDFKNTWLRSVNSKSIHFNDDVIGCRPTATTTQLRDCRSVETNKIIYYQEKTSATERTSSQLSCLACGCDSNDLSSHHPRLPYRQSSDTASTVSSTCCSSGRPHNISSSSIGSRRRSRLSSAANRSSVDAAVMGILSSSMSTRCDEGDGNDLSTSLLHLSGDSSSFGSGGRSQESCDQEKIYVESLLASIRSTARQYMTDVIAREAVLRQQQQQPQQQQHKQPQQHQQHQQQQHYKHVEEQQTQQQPQRQQQQRLKQRLLEQEWQHQRLEHQRHESLRYSLPQQEDFSESILTDNYSKIRS